MASSSTFPQQEARSISLRLAGEWRGSVPRLRHSPSVEFGPNLFFAPLERSADRAQLVDYEGTLAPRTAKRRAALPYPGVLDASEGRGLAVLGGRSPRSTRADARLEPPEELRDFLWRWRSAVASRRVLRDRVVRRAG